MSGERKKLISATVQISRTLILSLTGMFVAAGIKWPLNDIIKCELEGSAVNWVAFSSLALTGQVVILELSVHFATHQTTSDSQCTDQRRRSSFSQYN